MYLSQSVIVHYCAKQIRNSVTNLSKGLPLYSTEHKNHALSPLLTPHSLSSALTSLLPHRVRAHAAVLLTSLKHDLVTDSALFLLGRFPLLAEEMRSRDFRLLADPASLKFDIRYIICCRDYFKRQYSALSHGLVSL